MLNRFLIICLATCMVGFCVVGLSLAQDIPGNQNAPRQAQSSPQAPSNEPFYGYVPPPPIRHTWPGGYKVIFHELIDTLTEHMLGRY